MLFIRMITTVSLVLLAAVVVWTRRVVRWGATPAEIASAGTGDDWLDGVDGSRLRMTRAISIEAPPEAVWPWLAQMGRGAGWYSYDRLDNGGRASARHIVRWIPDPLVGDAAAIGYIRHLEPGKEIAWWSGDKAFLGARTWSLWRYRVVADGAGSRLTMRVDARAIGATRWLVVLLLPVIDSVMAVPQLKNLKDRAESHGVRAEEPDNSETGERDQYQANHVIYASGEQAGIPGREAARESRSSAEADGVL
jgi:hypothetical protein